MEKIDVLMNVIIISAFSFSSSRETAQGLTTCIHSPNGPLTQGPNSHSASKKKRERTFTGLFHRMQPLQPALTHCRLFSESQTPGGHDSTQHFAHTALRAAQDWQQKRGVKSLQKPQDTQQQYGIMQLKVCHLSHPNLLIITNYMKSQNSNLIAEILSFQFDFLSTGWRLHAVILRPT